MTYDANGRPAHSWRVLILPFLDKKELYDLDKFDEPWDSPHNSKLAEKMPDVYRCPSFKHHNIGNEIEKPYLTTQTNYVAIVGANTVFGKGQSRKIDDITDGVGQTLLLAETHFHAVHWMQPEDLSPREILTDLHNSDDEFHNNHTGGLHFAFADGRVHFFPTNTDPGLFLDLTTYAGKEPINENDY